VYLFAGLYARVPLLARAQDQRQRACKALAAARASGAEGENGCAQEHPTMVDGMFFSYGDMRRTQ
jgi:hypothetical protein